MKQPGSLPSPRMPDTTGLYASFPGGLANLRELTLRGAVLEDPDPLPIGSRLRLTLHLSALTVSCVGLVQRSILGEGMTVEFVDMSATDRKLLLERITAAIAAEDRERLKAGLSNATRAPATAATAPSSMPAPNPATPLPRYAELLVRRGAITAHQLAAAARSMGERQPLLGRAAPARARLRQGASGLLQRGIPDSADRRDDGRSDPGRAAARPLRRRAAGRDPADRRDRLDADRGDQRSVEPRGP